MNLEFYKGKKVLVTGHTGFKGSWLCKILVMAGAEVIGFAQMVNTKPSLFNILKLDNYIESNIGDIREFYSLNKLINKTNPEIIFHLAAQPLVIESYNNPLYTYETNVMGTVNLLEAIRGCNSVNSVVNITTDKVYENREWEWGYRECEKLNGYDPYSNSKSCSEIITSSYKKSFFTIRDISISTARAGNVIGGGDFSKDRIIPDCVKSAVNKEKVIVRNPSSIRPYQHVLDALGAYLLIAEKQYGNKKVEGEYNIGPSEDACITTLDLVKMFCQCWGDSGWCYSDEVNKHHEANYLKLDSSRIKKSIGWKSLLTINEAIEHTVNWNKSYYGGDNIVEITERQIENYFKAI